MTLDEKDSICDISKKIDFIGVMLLAWDLDSVDIGEDEKNGFYTLLIEAKEQLIAISNK